jgi:hypothetical protein
MPINYQKTYDTLSYEEGIEFRDLAIELIQEVYPHYTVKPFQAQNPDVIFITNQEDNVRIQFPLRDLYTRFLQTARTRTDLKNTILDDYAEAFKLIDDSDYFLSRTEPTWSEIRDSIQPRLTKIEEFDDDLELFVYFPFGEGIVTSVVICHSEAEMITRVRKEMLEKWNISVEEAYKKAMDNFANVTEGMELVGSGKPHAYLWNERGTDYSASAILLGGMRYLIAQTIGSPFRFGIPSVHAFYCWTELDDEEFQTASRAMIKRQYDTMPGRLSTNIYEVDENGNIKQLKDQPKIPGTPLTTNN